MIDRVVVGVHGSPGSLQALRFAMNHAHTFGAVLVPVIAWEPPGGDCALRPYPPMVTDEWAARAEDRLVAILEDVLEDGFERGVRLDAPAEPHVVRGKVGHVLVATANQDGDILVIGAGQRGPLRRAMYGSIPHYCLTRAQCEVFVVPTSSRSLARQPGRTGSAATTARPLPQ
jgi:nucleotide-binding universal stress UspA family protein